MLSDTDEETIKRPIAVRRGRRSGRASATILRKEVEVGGVLSGLDERGERRRERMEGRVNNGEEGAEGVGEDGEGAEGTELRKKKRMCCEFGERNVGCWGWGRVWSWGYRDTAPRAATRPRKL
jgi:hypothetical protein